MSTVAVRAKNHPNSLSVLYVIYTLSYSWTAAATYNRYHAICVTYLKLFLGGDHAEVLWKQPELRGKYADWDPQRWSFIRKLIFCLNNENVGE